MTLCLRAVDGKSKDNTIVREIEGDNLVQVKTESSLSRNHNHNKTVRNPWLCHLIELIILIVIGMNNISALS